MKTKVEKETYISNRNQDVYLNQIGQVELFLNQIRFQIIANFLVFRLGDYDLNYVIKKNNLVGQEINSKVDSLNDGCDWGSLLS